MVKEWNVYINRWLELTEEPIYKFYKEHLIPEIDILVPDFSNVQIIGESECGATKKESMRSCHPNVYIRDRRCYFF